MKHCVCCGEDVADPTERYCDSWWCQSIADSERICVANMTMADANARGRSMDEKNSVRRPAQIAWWTMALCKVDEIAERKAKWERERPQREAFAKVEAIKREDWLCDFLPRWFQLLDGETPDEVDKVGLADVLKHDCDIEIDGRARYGLYLHGASGSGKTFSSLALVRQAAEGYSSRGLNRDAIVRTNGMEFQKRVAALSFAPDKDDDGNAILTLEDFLAPMYAAGLLIFDEADKLNGSARVSQEFFALLDARLEKEVPTVLISFGSPIELAKLLDSKGDKCIGQQVARRIKDFFTVIGFQKGRPAKPENE